MSLFWLALAIALVLTIGSAIYVTRRGLQAFRAFKQLGRSVGGGLERIDAATGEIERHLTLAAEGGTQLETSLARLRASRAQLHVLTSAIADVRAAVGRVTGLVPRK
jgi:hypothetical protein